MTLRLLATAGAVIPAAVAALPKGGGPMVNPTGPTIWHVLGYPFEAGSMIAALCACAAVRFYVVHKDYAKHRWTLDVPVAALCLMFTGAVVIARRPEPFAALMYGTGIGVLGAGLIAIAKANVDKGLGALGLQPPPEKPEG